MSEEKRERRVPKLRFKGFTDDWMQEKGREIFNKRNENAIETEKFELNIGLENLVSNSGMLTGDTSIRSNSSSVFRRNDTLFGRLRPYLNKWWYATVDGIKSGEIWAIYPKGSNNSLFIYYLIQTERFLYYANISSGSRMPRASWEIITDKVFSYPVPNEQKLIAKLLYKLEKIITLEQEKMEKLQKTRSFLINNLLANKRILPKLRYSNFDRPWLSVKLKSVAELHNNMRIPVKASDRIPGKTPYYGANGIQGYVEGYTHDGAYALVAEDGANDIINYPSNFVTGKIWVNNHAHVLSGKEGLLDTEFLVYRIQSMNIAKYLVGSGRWKLNASTLGEIPISIPNVDEQIKIRNGLRSVDETIESTKIKIKLYKDIKIYLLQNLFV